MAEMRLDMSVDASKAVRGVKDFGKALDDVVDDLEKVSTQGDETEGDLVSNFRRMASESKKAGKDMDDGLSEGVKDFKDEAASTAKEAAASFDGSADSIVGTFQEVAANAFAGFGPAGALAGVAAAAGIGAAFAAIEQANEDAEAAAEAAKEKAAELADEFIEAGGVGVRSFEDLEQAAKDLATETDENLTNLADLERFAKRLKVPFEDVVSAYLNGGPALDELIRKTQDLNGENDLLIDAWTAESDVGLGKLYERGDAYKEITDALLPQRDAIKAAQDAELLYLQSGASEFEIKKELIGEISEAYDGVRDSAADAATSEEGVFDVGKWLTLVEESKKQVDLYKTNIAAIKLTPEQWTNLLSLPEEAKQSIAASLASPATDQATKDKIAAGLSDGGSQGGQDAAVAFENSFEPDADVTVTPEVNSKPANTAMTNLTKDRTLTITPRVDGRAAKTALDNLDRDRAVTYTAYANTWSADSALASVYNRYNGRTVTMYARVLDQYGKQVY